MKQKLDWSAGQIIDAINAEYAAAEAADLAAADPAVPAVEAAPGEPSIEDVRAARLRRFAHASDSGSGVEELDEPGSVLRPGSPGTLRRQQSVDLADALARARWEAAGSHNYRSMTISQLRAHARARFGPQYWQELEARGGRGGRHTALADLLYLTD